MPEKYRYCMVGAGLANNPSIEQTIYQQNPLLQVRELRFSAKAQLRTDRIDRTQKQVSDGHNQLLNRLTLLYKIKLTATGMKSIHDG